MLRSNARALLCVLFLMPMLTSTTVLAADLGSLTICKGVVGAALDPVDPTDTFTSDTAALHAVARIKEGAPGTKITGIWISVDAISTPNYAIDSTDLVLEKEGTVNTHFELSKPTKGWPTGYYKFDVFIDGKKAGSASFSIK